MSTQKSKTILVIEDDQEILFVLSELLADEGYKVLVAENGSIALEVVKEKGMPNLILLDMMMPIMNGTEFGLVFNATYIKPCPIVVMSAVVDVVERAKEIHAKGWIVKPFRLEEMLELVTKYSQLVA